MVTEDSVQALEDAEQLKALGYVSHFDRTMSKWENFSLGFTYLSPVVGVYTLFATSFAAGGPPMWWTYILVGVGQLMVCLVFGEIVSQFPISGGNRELRHDLAEYETHHQLSNAHENVGPPHRRAAGGERSGEQRVHANHR